MFLKKTAIPLLSLYSLLSLYAIAAVFSGVGYNPILTPISTLTAFVFAALHSKETLGWKRAVLLLTITFAVSLAFESVGVATGLVYGPYHYTDKLGVKFLGLVPLLIPIAWFMMSYPSFMIARRILPPLRPLWLWRVSFAAIGALVMTAWDLAMDPMMVAGGHWVWDAPGAYFDIPIQNFLGWWLTIFTAFLGFLFIAKVTPDTGKDSDPGFERLAVISYFVTGLSTVIMDFWVGLAGAGLAGLFAMLPWVLLGWVGNSMRKQ